MLKIQKAGFGQMIPDNSKIKTYVIEALDKPVL